MPLDATGAYTPDLQPPSPESIGVAPTAAPVAPDPNDPNNRPLVLSPLQEAPPQALPPAPAPMVTPPVTPVAPTPAAQPTPATPAPVHRAPVENSTIAGIRQANEDQQKATTDLGNVQQQAQNDIAEAHGKAAEALDQQAEETRQLREAQAKASDEAHRQTEAALEEAHKTRIPDFWEGREGERTEAAMYAGLGGIAAGLLHQSGNSAVDIINHNVDSYYRQQKEKVDNLYKFAESKGRSEEDLRQKQIQDLAALQTQFGATKLAIAARIDQTVAASQGRIDKAKADVMTAQLRSEGQASILSAKNTLSEINLRNAEAAKAREAANRDRTVAAQDKEVKPIRDEFDKDENRLLGTARSPGIVAQWSAIRELGNTLRDAVSSGDPTRIKAAIIQNKEKIARLNTGAAPSHEQMKLLESLTGDPAKVSERLDSLLGNPKASNQTVQGILDLVDQSDEGALKQIDVARGRVVQKYLGPNGMAKSKAQREHALGRISSITNGITSRTATGEVPRYQENGGTSAPAGNDMVTIKNDKGERKQVTREEARKLGVPGI